MPATSFLKQYPRVPFQQAVTPFAPQQQRFFSNQFSDIYNQYLGEWGGTGSFSDFLKQFDWLQKYQSFPPYQRGLRYGAMAPPTRYLNY